MEALYLKLEDLDIIIFMVKKEEKRVGWGGECVGGGIRQTQISHLLQRPTNIPCKQWINTAVLMIPSDYWMNV